MPIKQQSKKSRLFFILVIFIILFFTILAGVGLSFGRNRGNQTLNLETETSVNQISQSSEKIETVEVDWAGIQIQKNLKTTLNLNMGFIYTDTIVDLGIPIPLEVESQYKVIPKSTLELYDYPDSPRLADLIKVPENPEKTNWLSFPDYSVEAPIIYASFQDMFETDENNLVDFSKPIIEDREEVNRGNYESVPVQRLLRNGIVHLPYSPYPGELGNSYIIGHSSNFSQVQSDYNFVFKSLVKQTKDGDIFYIYDKDGRKLKFKVFESLEIFEDEIEVSYKNYPDKRVVTLQGSILVTQPDGSVQPTKRWLTKGELILD